MPATRSSPASGRTRVATALTNVVLPAPFGPSSAVTPPDLGDEVEAGERVDVAEPLGQAVGFDDGGHGVAPC